MSELHNSRSDRVAAPADLPPDPLSEQQLSYVPTKQKNNKEIISLIFQKEDVDTNVTQTIEDSSQKSEPMAVQASFCHEIVPIILFLQSSYHLADSLVKL